MRSRIGTRRGGVDQKWTWSMLSLRSKDTGFGDGNGVSATTMRHWDDGTTKAPMTSKLNAALAPFGKRLGIVNSK